STAQDRREMLEEIMRKGTSSLGNDVPSEREINRLAARSDEEFWLFERMDEERRQKENYRTRLMEEHEVPDWVYTVSDLKTGKNAANNDVVPVTGKRQRKEVIRDDSFTHSQWNSGGSTSNAGDLSASRNHPAKRRKENNENPPQQPVFSTVSSDHHQHHATTGLKKLPPNFRNETASEDQPIGWSYRRKSEAESSQTNHHHRPQPWGKHFNGLTWRGNKKKRSSLM
ncbi:hypothetical protein M569_11354, partial [Genlisea aurea]